MSNLALFGLLVAVRYARAQVTFSGSTTTNASYSSSSSISPLAVDSSGDQFYVVNDGSSNILYKIPAGGSPTALNSSFPYMPSALAVNPAGSALYMIYSASSPSCNGLTYQRVSMVSTAVNSTPADLAQCFTNFGYNASYSDPTGLATDSSGNLYVADFGAGTIWKIPATITSASHPTLMLELLQQPAEVTIVGGTVYYTALNGSSQNTLYSTSASNFSSSIPSGPASSSSLATIPSIQSGIAADSSGNLYLGTPTGVDKYSGGTLVTVNSSLSGGASGVAVDSSDHLYFDGTDSSGNPLVLEAGGSTVNFGSVNVGSTSSTMGLPFTVGASSSTTVTSIQVLTLGATGLDFADAGGSTCTAKTYSSSTNCTVNVKFSPQHPGLRAGAVAFYNGSTVLDTVYIYGSGSGPQVVFSPAQISTLGSGFSQPTGVAVDGAGNVYVADYSSGAVKEIVAAGGYTTVNTLGSGFTEPAGIAVDGGGNVFVADYSSGAVKEIVAAGGYTTVNTLASGFSGPAGLAVDSSGNLFVADTFNNAVKEIVAAGGYTTINTLGSGFSEPYGVAVDASGNVFVADTFNNAVKEIVAAGGYTTVNTLGSGFTEPAGIAVDASGNVFVADLGNGAVKEIVAAGGYTTVKTLGSGFSEPYDVAVDGSGDAFVTDLVSTVKEMAFSVEPSLSFASTAVGSTSTDSPQTVTVSNDGNATLTFELPTASGSYNPSVAPNWEWNNASTCLQTGASSSTAYTLASGASCTIVIDFKPQSVGSLSGTVVLTDNNLNTPSPYAAQTIDLSGQGISNLAATQAIASETLTQNYAASAFTPVTGSGGTGSLSYSVSPALPTGLSMSSSTGAITGTPTVTSTATSYTVTVKDTNNATATASFTLTVNAAVAATQAVASEMLTENYAASAFTPVTGSGGTGSLSYSVSPALPTGLSMSSTTGAITGTPTVTSAATSYTVTVKDTNNATATASFTLTVNAAVAATQAVASEMLTQNYAASAFTPVTGSGGTGSLSYSVSPALPTGLSMSSSTGAITGTPTVTSAATSYTVTVKDTNNATATAGFTLTVNAAVAATQAVASEMLTQNYAASAFTPVTGSGGTGSLSYSVSPALPTGLSMSSTTGAITGTPTVTSAATSYTVTVKDTNNATATAGFTLTVNAAVAATQAVASEMLTENYAASAFTPVTGSGGTGSLSYSVSPALPTGLSMSSTTGAITGTPTVTSAATSYTVTVKDSNNATATASFTLTVNAAVAATQSVASEMLTQNYAASAFTPVTGSGGTGSLSYSVSPVLPTGLSMSSTTGAITGTPTVTSTATSYTVTVKDTNNATATASFTLTVNAAVAATQAVASEMLTENYAASAFTPVTGSGGTGSLSYSVSPALPTGLSMSSTTGAITGTPTVTSAATSYTVTVKDTNNATATASFTLTVNAAVAATQAVASEMLTENYAASAFTPVTGSGGTGTLSYSVSPALPTGLSMSSTTGAITGTPTVTSAATSYTVTVKDTNNATATASFTLTVNAAVTATEQIPSTALSIFAAASFTPVAGSGGTGTLSYSLSPALPTGLSMSSATGAITGTPTVISTTTNYTVTVTDGNGATAQATFSLAVNKANTTTQLSLSTTSITPGQSVTLSTQVISAAGGTPTGSVSFYDGTTLLSTVTLTNATATYSTSALAPGLSHALTANYLGDAEFNPSVSQASADTTVTVAPLDFTMTLSGPTNLTVVPGQSVSYQVQVSPDYGSYAGTVTFAMTGLPPGATATFSPSSVAANDGPRTISVTIHTAPATAAVPLQQQPFVPGRRLAPFALGFLMLFGAGSLRKRGRALQRFLCVLVLAAGGLMALGVSGCGGHSGFFAQAPQSYVVTVTATSSNLQHSANITLNVQ